MKTQWSIINSILLGIAALRNTLVEKSTIDLQWAKQIFSTRLSWSSVSNYVLPLLKTGLKEAIGYEVEIELLLLLIAGYFFAVRSAIFSISLFKFNKLNHTQSSCYNLCGA
jgi:hypothetical protein